MNYETQNDQQIDKSFSQLIASAEASMGAPASWYLANTTEEKRKILIDNLAPKKVVPRNRVPLSGPYTPWPPLETIGGEDRPELGYC